VLENRTFVPVEAIVVIAIGDALTCVGAEAHVEAVRRRVAEGVSHLDGDTPVCADSHAAAVRAAGAALALGEALLDGRIEAGFGAVRPPGHHATPDRAMGFCLFNNIAVLACFLRAHGKRPVVVDWDVHHGNGTQDIFWNDRGVAYASLHQSPLYPGTGAADETGAGGAGHVLNVPLPPGTTGAAFRAAFEERVVPWTKARDGDVLLVSAGFDAHRNDPLAQFGLNAEDYAELTRMLLGPGLPVLSLLEGGYDLDALRESTRAHVRALLQV